MTVGELKLKLEELPEDMVIILQKDSEGNGYSPLSGADADAVYLPNNKWSGEAYSTVWEAEDVCMGEEEWSNLKRGPKSLILYPLN